VPVFCLGDTCLLLFFNCDVVSLEKYGLFQRTEGEGRRRKHCQSRQQDKGKVKLICWRELG
jgi:hypothetical protein